MVNINLSESKRAKKNSGITLIALVVTIVVLIILATVSILAVFGDNGIIARAQKAKDTHEEGKADETNTLDDYASYIGNYLDGKGGSSGGSTTNHTAGTEVTKPGTWTSTEVTPIADGNGGTVPLPSGFHYVGGDISTGLVISDKEGDTMDASGVDMGNQFVWIPVSSEDDLTRTNFDSTTGQPKTGLSTNYTEPYANGYSTETSEYTTMRTQVLKYGGFYIGRFEAGVNSTTLRDDATTAQTVVCKKGVAPYNRVPWGTSMSDASEVEGESGAVYLAKSMYSSSNSVTSTLTYGCQWDAMCRYIGDSQRITPATKVVALTGSVSTDVSKNIYDLAGNCNEWTMEAYRTDNRVIRGGRYSYSYSVSSRSSHGIPTNGNDVYSFRPTLYIK